MPFFIELVLHLYNFFDRPKQCNEPVGAVLIKDCLQCIYNKEFFSMMR